MAEFPVVFALYPRITQLDFTGPLEVLTRLPGARIVLASVEGGPLVADCGLTFANVVRLSRGRRVRAAVRARGVRLCRRDGRTRPTSGSCGALPLQARYVTSVCTGSLLLGAAGLLRGRRAACHWGFRELLPLFGAIARSGTRSARRQVLKRRWCHRRHRHGAHRAGRDRRPGSGRVRAAGHGVRTRAALCQRPCREGAPGNNRNRTPAGSRPPGRSGQGGAPGGGTA